MNNRRERAGRRLRRMRVAACSSLRRLTATSASHHVGEPMHDREGALAYYFEQVVGLSSLDGN